MDVLVVGGGVIGASCAYYLARQGMDVTLVEKTEIASGCSNANAGLVVPSHIIPMASPGAVKLGLRSLLKPASPFYVKPSLDPGLWRWLYLFYKASGPQRMLEALPILRDLGILSTELFESVISEENLACDYHENGWLLAYKTEKGFKHAQEEARLLQDYDIDVKILDSQEVLAKEPALSPKISGGIYFPNDSHLDPAEFTQAVLEKASQVGVSIYEQTQVKSIETTADRVTSVQTTQGLLEPKSVVLAAGVWTPQLLKPLNLRPPLQPAKGYSISFPRPEVCPKVPLYLSEAKVAVTPFEGILRFAGTLELSGLSLKMNNRRINAILKAKDDYLEPIDRFDQAETWCGLRCCTPDGLPIIDRLQRYINLYIATGHGMLGITLAPVTGLLISQLVCGQKTDLDLTPMQMDRF